MRRLLAVATMALAVGVGDAAPAHAGTLPDYRSMDVEIEVDPAGSFVVTETIVVEFRAGRRGIIRNLPVKYAYDGDHLRVTDVEVLSVTRDGAREPRAAFREGAQDEVLVIRVGDPDVYLTGRHVYELRYRVTGWLNPFPEHVELYWNAVGSYWESSFDTASVTVRGPDAVRWTCYSGPAYETAACEDLGSSSDGVRYGTSDVGVGTDLTVVVGFDPLAVSVPEVKLEEVWRDRLAFEPTRGNVGLAVGAGLPLVAGLALLLRRGRDERHVGLRAGDHPFETEALAGADPDDAPVQFRPPEGLAPAHLGLIDDEKVDPVDAGATVLDLAVRGHLRVEDRRAEGDDDPDWVVVLHRGANPDDQLVPFEARLLDGLEKHAEGGEVRLDDLDGAFASDFKKFADLVYEDAMHRHWFRRRPDRVRAAYLAVAIAGLALAPGIAFAAIGMRQRMGLLAAPVVAVSLVLLIAHRRMPAKTARGRGVLVVARGFKKFIETAEKPEMNYAVQQNEFVRYLPYAVAFGSVEAWARATQGIDVAAATAGWYTGPVFHDWGTFGSGFSDFSSSVGTHLASSPASSGGSGFSSGGGFSGGGGGGGGGGSW